MLQETQYIYLYIYNEYHEIIINGKSCDKLWMPGGCCLERRLAISVTHFSLPLALVYPCQLLMVRWSARKGGPGRGHNWRSHPRHVDWLTSPGGGDKQGDR